MKTLLAFIVLILGFSSVQATPLKSENLRYLICNRMDDLIWDMGRFSDEICVEKGNFKVTKRVFNQQVRMYTRLSISFSYEENKIEVNGTVDAVRSLSFNDNGEVQANWELTKFNSKVNDKRNYVEVFNQMLDDQNVNFHNGDAGIYDVKPSHSLTDLVKDLEEGLEDYGDPETDNEYDFCQYETVTGTKDVIYYLEDHSSDAADFLKSLQKKGLIKDAAYRGYSDGASEYCSYYYFQILMNDNKVIYLDFDFTT